MIIILYTQNHQKSGKKTNGDISRSKPSLAFGQLPPCFHGRHGWNEEWLLFNSKGRRGCSTKKITSSLGFCGCFCWFMLFVFFTKKKMFNKIWLEKSKTLLKSKSRDARENQQNYDQTFHGGSCFIDHLQTSVAWCGIGRDSQ